ncbi:MAG: hypothetical protein QXI12_13310 [Candidatus Methanomethyliaceae archaeon]
MSVGESLLYSQMKKLPDGWRWVKLGDVCIINPKRPVIQRDEDELTSFLPMSAASDGCRGIQFLETRPFKEVNKGYTYFAEKDIL